MTLETGETEVRNPDKTLHPTYTYTSEKEMKSSSKIIENCEACNVCWVGGLVLHEY